MRLGERIESSKARRALAAEGFEKKQLGNYLYTVIMRLKERGVVVKQRKGKYALANSDTESEAADDAHGLNGSSTASVDHRPTSGGTHSGPVYPRPGGGT